MFVVTLTYTLQHSNSKTNPSGEGPQGVEFVYNTEKHDDSKMNLKILYHIWFICTLKLRGETLATSFTLQCQNVSGRAVLKDFEMI